MGGGQAQQDFHGVALDTQLDSQTVHAHFSLFQKSIFTLSTDGAAVDSQPVQPGGLTLLANFLSLSNIFVIRGGIVCYFTEYMVVGGRLGIFWSCVFVNRPRNSRSVYSLTLNQYVVVVGKSATLQCMVMVG